MLTEGEIPEPAPYDASPLNQLRDISEIITHLKQ